MVQKRNEFICKGAFPGVVGCVDGTHIRLQRPSQNEADYVNRKGYHSINVQAICDHIGIFTNIVAKWLGSTHDSFIFTDSVIGQQLQTQPQTLEDGLLLGDSGYPCRPFLMTPYLNPSSAQQEAFNRAHTKTHVAIKQAFGWWKRRFHPLHSEIRMTPEKACLLIVFTSMAAALRGENQELKQQIQTLSAELESLKSLITHQLAAESHETQSTSLDAETKSNLEFYSKEYDDLSKFRRQAQSEIQRLSSRLTELSSKVDAVRKAVDKLQDYSL
ncbi:PREDICTED: putative nuclease HARBI1 [Acropora digitifera]|uniref:putative nuclease HARBI1 n=1 Tax=Acropora digitifera TaxID=70779 RepID=UPI00077ABDA7|nr:PREDICTED: putative nuclease HARBI1 [Acropora digitifera]